MLSAAVKTGGDDIITFSVNPQQGAGCLPFREHVPFGAPRCRALLMSFKSNVEVRRRIGWSNPFSKVLAGLVSYKRGQAFVIDSDPVRLQTV